LLESSDISSALVRRSTVEWAQCVEVLVLYKGKTEGKYVLTTELSLKALH